MSNGTSGAASGISFFGAMFLLFLGLKLVGYVDWSWWIICAPLYGPWILLFFVVILCKTLAPLFEEEG